MRVLRTVLQLLTFHLITVTAFTKRSGIYSDNGFDQTVFHEIQNEKTHRFIRQEILSVLDIPVDGQETQEPETEFSSSASSFLMDVYKLTTDNETKKLQNQELEKLQYFDVNDMGMNSIVESNLIITLAARNRKKDGLQKTEKVKRLWFNVSLVSPEDTIIRGELKLFRTMNGVKTQNQGIATIRVYRITSDRATGGYRDKIFVDAVNTTEKDGWVTLNVTESLHYWLRGSGVNRGLYLEASTSHWAGEKIKPEAVGIVGFKGVPEKQPFMVVYVNANTPRRRRGFDFFQESKKITFQKTVMKPRIPTSCRKQNLYVNFKDLNLDKIIIAPRGFDAFYCHGLCDYPMNFNMNATNHAIIQGFLNLKNPEKAPRPCCAPSKTSTIHVIFRTDGDTFVIKKRENMKVDSCGCM